MASTTPSTGMSEAEAAMSLLGSDPWLRFDLWASRSWESAQRAIEQAVANGTPVDDGIDPRIVAMFHATEVAKEFAEMVNPLIAISGVETSRDSLPVGLSAATIEAILGDDD